eukprot:gene16717-19871_t
MTEDDVKQLLFDIKQQAVENVGTSMIFILAGTIKEWLDNNNEEPVEEISEEESSSSEEEEHVFEGTPVTVENFNIWRQKFLAEVQPLKATVKTTKVTGRKLFEIDSSLILSDSKFMAEGEETSNISASSVKAKIEDVAAQVDWALFGEADSMVPNIEDDE